MKASMFENAYAVEQRSIARGDARWLQIVYRNAQAYVDMIKSFPRMLKKSFPSIIAVWLCNTAVRLSDFGKRFVDFFKNPSIVGFFAPILSLLGWSFLLLGGFVLLAAVWQAIFAKSNSSTNANKQDTDLELCAEDRGTEEPEGPNQRVVGDQDNAEQPRRPWGRGSIAWFFGCMIFSQLAMILGFFLPCIWLMHLDRWGGDSADDFGIFDFIFLLSSLLALIAAMELLAWALFFVMITIGDIVLDSRAQS